MKISEATRLAILENNYINMNKKLDGLSDKFDELKECIDKLPEKLDQRYASKDTEVAVTRIMWIVITAVIVALLALIIKN